MQRLLALIIMVIPGILAAYGIKLMRDMFFNILYPPFPFLALQFLVGLLFFVGGLGFIGGFVFRRDRKRNKVQEKFKQKRDLTNKNT